jgi:serine/threonine protein phosphatase PrpC
VQKQYFLFLAYVMVIINLIVRIIKKRTNMKKKLLLFLGIASTLCLASENNSILISQTTKKPTLSAGYYSIANGRPQQDALACCSVGEKKDFFAVYDGYGGPNLSYCLAMQMHDRFRSFMQQSSSIKQAFELTYGAMEEYALENYKEGSTAITVCVEIDKKIIHVAWAGISRAVLEQKGEVSFVTSDHFFNTNAQEVKRVKAHGAQLMRELTENTLMIGDWRVNGLNMSRSIGDKWVKGINAQPSTYKQPIRQENGLNVFFQYGDETIPAEVIVEPKKDQIIATPEYKRIPYNNDNKWFIVGSKNLWQVVSNQEAIDLAEQNKNLKNSGIAQVLIETAKARGSNGNITAIVVKLPEPWEDGWTEL